MSNLTIKVEGLREIQKALRQMSTETPRLIQSVHREVAEIIVPVARRNANSVELAQRITAVGTTRKAAIRFKGHKPKGRSRSTDALLQEFGGRAPLFGNLNFWHTVKPKRKQGYIIYPAIKATRQQVMDVYLAKLDEAIRRHWTE